MQRKRYGGGKELETFHVFVNRRRFCDKKCFGAFLESRVNGEGHKSTYHARARRKAKQDHCERCGRKENELTRRGKKKEKLQVHHKDRNVQNNELNNLETLCIECHYNEHHPVEEATF